MFPVWFLTKWRLVSMPWSNTCDAKYPGRKQRHAHGRYRPRANWINGPDWRREGSMGQTWEACKQVSVKNGRSLRTSINPIRYKFGHHGQIGVTQDQCPRITFKMSITNVKCQTWAFHDQNNAQIPFPLNGDTLSSWKDDFVGKNRRTVLLWRHSHINWPDSINYFA